MQHSNYKKVSSHLRRQFQSKTVRDSLDLRVSKNPTIHSEANSLLLLMSWHV